LYRITQGRSGLIDLLGFFYVIPKARLAYLFIKNGKLVFFAWKVKDAPEACCNYFAEAPIGMLILA